jgi:hypothetical protein
MALGFGWGPYLFTPKGRVDGIMMNHLDCVQGTLSDEYPTMGRDISPLDCFDLRARESFTKVLMQERPVLSRVPSSRFLSFLEKALTAPVVGTSYGPDAKQKLLNNPLTNILGLV